MVGKGWSFGSALNGSTDSRDSLCLTITHSLLDGQGGEAHNIE